MTQFTDLGLAAPILGTLNEEGYLAPTPIQAKAIPHVLAGRDLLGIAATGTGKTAAFALPILQHLAAAPANVGTGRVRALILAPTRELAAQIGDSFRVYGRGLGLRTAVVVGGVAFGPQTKALGQGLDVLIATPGRLLDHIGRGAARLDATGYLVLDEADQMLDLGFIPAIRRIVRQLPGERQNLFFSATMPAEIGKLAAEILRRPVTVSVTPSATPAERIDQRVIHVEPRQKGPLLARILRERDGTRVLVFTRTKRGADKVVRGLSAERIGAVAIHGNKSQSQRTRALAGFRDGATPVLVATDIAARGIDIDDVGLVVNFDLPHVPETYVHRIGRTARAGASGAAIAFCGEAERPLLRAIEKLIRSPIGTGETPEPAANRAERAAPPAVDRQRARPSRRRGPRKRGDAAAQAAAAHAHEPPVRTAPARGNGKAKGGAKPGTTTGTSLADMPFMRSDYGAAAPARPAKGRKRWRHTRSGGVIAMA